MKKFIGLIAFFSCPLYADTPDVLAFYECGEPVVILEFSSGVRIIAPADHARDDMKLYIELLKKSNFIIERVDIDPVRKCGIDT